MNQAELNDHLGVGDMRAIVIDGKMLPGPCSSRHGIMEMMMNVGKDEAIEIIIEGQTRSLLDICLGGVESSIDDVSYDVYIPVPTEIIVATANGPEATDMVICPQSGSRDKLGPGVFSLPMFEVEYHIGDLIPDSNFNLLRDSLEMMRLRFESDLLIDLLSKSVRSQRNRIDAPFSMESISKAMELIERESREVRASILNTRAYAEVREGIDHGRLFGAEVFRFSARKRQDIRRNYFLGPSNMLGVFASSDPEIEIGEGFLTMKMRMGAAILDRSLISSIDGPQ